jgi:CubicO group peptidase (beta-lactamase class C family)
MAKRTLLLLCVFAMLVTGCSPATSSPAPDDQPIVEADIQEVTEVVEAWPGEEWQVADSPEQLGWSSGKLARVYEYADQIGSAALMIVEGGVVVDTWGDIERNYKCHSMRKSLLSALYGIYAEQGKIELGATLEELGIDEREPLSEAEKRATVQDLLMARSGVYLRAAGESDSMAAKRPERGSHPSGTFWYYNNWDFNALGTIFDQLSGEQNIYQAFKKRIADPLGMQDYKPKRNYTYASYSRHPYYDFRMSTRDLARFGLLFLREGRWGDAQVVPAAWVSESTASQSERQAGGGYGYMWWTGTAEGVFPHVYIDGHAYWAWGYNAHLVLVLPHLDLVIVHREDTDQTNPSLISESNLGVLLWYLLDAAGVDTIGDPPSTIEMAPGERLTTDRILSVFSGSTLSRQDAAGLVEAVFDADAGLALYLDGQQVAAGSWLAEDDQLCVEFDDPQLAGGCDRIVLDEGLVRLYGPDGILKEEYTYQQD